MGFSFLRKKKPKKPASMMGASSSSAAHGGKAGASRARNNNNNNNKNPSSGRGVSGGGGPLKKSKSSRSQAYGTPLVTIEEHELHHHHNEIKRSSGSRRSRGTETTTSTTTMINVMTESDGDTELVYGDVQRQLFVQEDVSVYDDDDDDTTLGEPIAVEALNNNNYHFNELWEREDAASIVSENSVGTPVVTRVFRAVVSSDKGKKQSLNQNNNSNNSNHYRATTPNNDNDDDDDATNDEDESTLNSNGRLVLRERVHIHVQDDRSLSNNKILKKFSSSMEEYDPPIITKAPVKLLNTQQSYDEPNTILPPGVFRPPIRSRPITSSFQPDDEPFDEKMMEKEDPYIIELRRNDSKDEEEKLRSKARGLIVRQQQQQDGHQLPQPDDELKHDKKVNNEFRPIVVVDEEAAMPTLLKQNIMDALNCHEDTATNFYDTICTTDVQPKKRKRPYFDEAFAKKFMQEGMDDGVPMLWHVPPASAIDNDWTGQSVTMFISAGAGMERRVVHPHLIWMSEEGGYSRLTESDAAITIAVDILDIHSIMDRMDEMDEDGEEDDLFFFSITTKDGTVHLFECPSERDRDRTVAGIKNILARLTYSLIVGDDSATMEVYGGDEDDEGALPSLKTPAQEMMNISHAFLDAITKQ